MPHSNPFLTRIIPIFTTFFASITLRPGLLPGEFQNFLKSFWSCYWSQTKDSFERNWASILEMFPTTEGYLMAELYRNDQDGHGHGTLHFTAGTRTTGRVESENDVHTHFLGAKLSISELLEKLNGRTSNQTDLSDMAIYKAVRDKHVPGSFERAFEVILDDVKGVFSNWGFHRFRREVADFWFSSADSISDIHTYYIPFYLGDPLEDLSEQAEPPRVVQELLKDLTNVHVTFVQKVSAIEDRQAQYVIALEDGTHVCTCLLGVNLGLPCKYYLAAWLKCSRELNVHPSLFNSRWSRMNNLNDTSAKPHRSRSTNRYSKLAPTNQNPFSGID